MVKIFRLANLDCAVCAGKMEKSIKKIEGINSVSISFINQKMILDADNIDLVFDEVVKACKKVEPDLEIK